MSGEAERLVRAALARAAGQAKRPPETIVCAALRFAGLLAPDELDTDGTPWDIGRISALRIRAGRYTAQDVAVLADAFETLTRERVRNEGYS